MQSHPIKATSSPI